MRPMARFKDMISLRHQADLAANSLPSLMMKAEQVANGILHGDHALRKAGAGEKFWQFRDYQTGDRPQEIDWRQSAKGERIFIRQKEWQIAQKTFFWCSHSSGMDYSSARDLPSKGDCARVITLALAILLSRAHEQVGVYGEKRTGRSEANLQHFAQTLLNTNTQKDASLPNTLGFALPQNATLVMAGDFLDPLPRIAEAFDVLSASTSNGLIVQILDPQEMDLNFEGRVMFHDLPNGERETVNNVASIRAQYMQRIEDHLEEVYSLCAGHGWPYVLHRTDHDIADTVTALWLMVASAHQGVRS